MPRSRTIITLSALLAAMTVGTFVLLALETTPAQPSAIAALAASHSPSPLEDSIAAALALTDVPLQPGRWTSIVVHDCAGGPHGPCPAGSHFVVDVGVNEAGQGPAYATARWARQAPGIQEFVADTRFNAGAVGICLTGDLGQAPPADGQVEALAALVRSLRARLGIPADRVYLHSDLAGVACPGGHFPVDTFRVSVRNDRL